MYRSTREAFPVERFPALFGPYRRDTFSRCLLRMCAWAVVCAGFGAALAWSF